MVVSSPTSQHQDLVQLSYPAHLVLFPLAITVVLVPQGSMMADPEIPRDVTPGATHGVPVEELGMSGGETPAEAGVTSTGVNQGNGSSVTEWHSAADIDIVQQVANCCHAN